MGARPVHRAISGKLIIGLVVLFGLATVVVSQVTANQGQAADTFLTILSSSGQVEQYYYVSQRCTLTASDQATLAGLRTWPT